ncbi:MAG: hypothetical protein KQH83_02630 [Actinobacteria bacterium]|nr:hypothetical protein [Actinomycetota bacterium]
MRRILHLARRFFESLGTRPLTPAEQQRAAGWLEPADAPLFWSQQPLDQRHGLSCADHVAVRCPERRDLVRAALLHDVGKRHARLGVAARVVAGGFGLLRLPAPGRLGTHLRHGALGADDLAAAGAEDVVVAFARGHHGPAPEGTDPAEWALLREADGE